MKTPKQNKDIIIKLADKNAAIVVMNKTNYVGEAERQLANQVHHKRLEEPVYTKKKRNYLKCPEDPAPRRMYLLPKIHKKIKVWPGEGKSHRADQ